MYWFLNTIKGLGRTQLLPLSIAGIRERPFLLLAVMVAFMLVASSAVVVAQDDLNSTPLEQPFEPPEEILTPEVQAGPVIPSLVTIGQNFRSSRRNIDSGFIPPDTMGAVGPDHIVELINGNFEVFNKATGASLRSRSLDGFWTTDVGLTIPNFNDTCVGAPGGTCSVSTGPCETNNDCVNNFTFDPRIVYDPDSGRWFAAALDATNPATGDNNIYVGRSDTDDPTGDWDGVLFDADTVAPPEFHDYDTLAVDADGLYICTQDFDTGSGGGGVESCYSIPKADLLLAAPSIANMTRFENNPPNLPPISGSIQPVLDFGPSDGRAAWLGVASGALVRGDILDADTATATLGAPTSISGDPGHAGPPQARQPDPFGTTIENVAPRFVSNVFEQGDSLWAVHAVQGSFSNSALRWYEIDETTNTVLQTGLIEDKDQDFHEPSIVANQFGNVVIGYTCSGPNLSPSACVSVGVTESGTTTFEPPMVLQLGAGYYYRDFPLGRNRWGDYSATVIDPVDACTFWTFQEFVAVSAVGQVGPFPLPDGGQWGIQVTELIINTPVISVPGNLSFDDTCDGNTSTVTLEVCNTTPNSGICANLVIEAITSSDAQFEVIEPSSEFPVVISPDFCFPFQVQFTPDSAGSQSATLGIESNDSENPLVEITATANGAEPVIDAFIGNAGNFGDVCLGEFKDLDMTISNSGGCDLTVSGILSISPEFKTPADIDFPQVIAPGGSLRVPLRLEPALPLGAKNTTISVASDAGTVPLNVSGNLPPGDIRVTGSTDFGEVCAGELAEKTVSVCNVGPCNLSVTSASINCSDFTLINNSFPATVSPDSCVDLVVRFTPTTAGPKTCDLTIISDDPDTPTVLTLTAETPFPSIDVPPDQSFSPTVIQSVDACESPLPFPVSNTGTCDLTITAFSISTNPAEYSLSGLPSFPIILEPGHVAGEGALNTVFAPTLLDRDELGVVSVTYVSEPITGATTIVPRNLCGEGVRTGARVLVTQSGTPLSEVKQIKLSRLGANRNKNRLDTVDNVKDAALQTVNPTSPCPSFQYHREYSTVSNPIQLAPGSYVVTVQARINGKIKHKTVGFDVSSCDFNQNIVVDF
jgi:hypothetical protein